MKPYERDVKFVNNVTTTLLDEQMTKIKVVDFDEFYNFVVVDFFSWNHLLFENVVSSCHFLKFKFWIVQTTSHEKMTKIKFVDLDEFYNFYVHHLFSWNVLLLQNIVWSCYFLKFKIWIDRTKSHEKMTKIIAVRTQ